MSTNKNKTQLHTCNNCVCFVLAWSSSSNGASERLCFVIVAFPGYLHLFFTINTSMEQHSNLNIPNQNGYIFPTTGVELCGERKTSPRTCI